MESLLLQAVHQNLQMLKLKILSHQPLNRLRYTKFNLVSGVIVPGMRYSFKPKGCVITDLVIKGAVSALHLEIFSKTDFAPTYFLGNRPCTLVTVTLGVDFINNMDRQAFKIIAKRHFFQDVQISS